MVRSLELSKLNAFAARDVRQALHPGKVGIWISLQLIYSVSLSMLLGLLLLHHGCRC